MFNVVYIYSVPNCKYLTVRNEYLTLSWPSGAWEKKKKKIGFSFYIIQIPIIIVMNPPFFYHQPPPPPPQPPPPTPHDNHAQQK